jgi:hypothetical protein
MPLCSIKCGSYSAHTIPCIFILLPISHLTPFLTHCSSLPFTHSNPHISPLIEQLKCIALVYCSPFSASYGSPAFPVNSVHASSLPPRYDPTTGVESWPVGVARESSSQCAVSVLQVTLHSRWSFPRPCPSCRRALIRPQRPSQTRRLCRTATEQQPFTGPTYPSTRPSRSSVPSRPRWPSMNAPRMCWPSQLLLTL